MVGFSVGSLGLLWSGNDISPEFSFVGFSIFLRTGGDSGGVSGARREGVKFRFIFGLGGLGLFREIFSYLCGFLEISGEFETRSLHTNYSYDYKGR